MRLFTAVMALVLVLAMLSSCTGRNSDGVTLSEVVGVTHVGGQYNFSGKDFLNEGADALLELGTRVIKVWLTNQYREVYPFNSAWPEVNTMTELAKTEYYRELFKKPYTTFILEAHELCAVNWKDGLSLKEAETVSSEFYELASYLMTEYKNSGKTFILQNWEGDNLIGQDASDTAVKGMIDWFNARQQGITRARNESGSKGVKVAGAAEINKISSSWLGPKVIDVVIPYTNCDLYSYSNWETGLNGELLKKNLDYFAEKAPDSKLYGEKNIYIGEFGAGEMLNGGPTAQLNQVSAQVEAALDWGVRYIVYWELYCNERRAGANSGKRPIKADMSGFWLIRPDGGKTPVWDYFEKIYKTNDYKSEALH